MAPARFRLTGILSGFLDNMSSYLVFFDMAARVAAALMGPAAQTLFTVWLGPMFILLTPVFF
ncbi:MAG: sodium:proton antiporter [Alphaproteobacteria bacterium]|nr:sodium:proton antiporter [Alphaproteobacteria bacterium]